MINSNTGAHAQMDCTSYSVLADRSGYGSTNELVGCGNGTLDSYEDCDDGNLENGDGCSSECQIEFGFECCINGKRFSANCVSLYMHSEIIQSSSTTLQLFTIRTLF